VNPQKKDNHDFFFPVQEKIRYDNYLIGFSQKGKGHARHNFIFSDGTRSGLKSKQSDMKDVFIPENVTIRRIIMFHMNDGTYL